MVWTPRQSRMLGTSDGAVATAAISSMGRKVPWTRQPQYAAQIDWCNPLTEGLWDAWNFANPYQSVVHNYPGLPGASYSTVDRAGKGIVLPQQYDSTQTLLQDGSVLPLGDVTVVYIHTEVSTLRRGFAAFNSPIPGAASSSHFNAYIPYIDNMVYWRWGDNSGLSVTIGPLLGGDIFVFSAGAKGKAIWQNGKLLASNGSTTVRAAADPTRFIFGEGAPATNAHQLIHYGLFIFARQLSKDEIVSISSNPWQIFKSPSKLIWVPA